MKTSLELVIALMQEETTLKEVMFNKIYLVHTVFYFDQYEKCLNGPHILIVWKYLAIYYTHMCACARYPQKQ